MMNLDMIQKKEIEKKGLIPLANGSDFIGHRNCIICKQKFSFVIRGIVEALYCHELPEICEKEECKNFRQAQCGICDKKFIYDTRLKGMRWLCSPKCEEEQDKKHRLSVEKNLKEKINTNITRIIPPKYIGIKSDKQIEPFIDKSLYIFGNAGTGKSVFMSNLAIEYIKRELGVKWVSITTFIMELQSLYRENGNPFFEAEKVAEFNGFLCLDDLGACKITEYVAQIIYYIFNYREEYCLPTLVTSNYSLSKIDDIIGGRVSSRIAGICEIIEFSGEDRRLSTKQKPLAKVRKKED